MSETPNLEDLLAAIATLTEHNTALLERIEEKDQATKDRDAANAKLVNDLIAQLKDYQERENKIKSATMFDSVSALCHVRIALTKLITFSWCNDAAS